MEAKKAVILARVSSKEQEDGYSIDAQKHRLQEYCKRKNLTVLKVFEIVESSTKGDRKRFTEMLAFVRRYKDCIAIVADKVDRVQRSFKEFPVLDDLICRGSIELHFNTENYIIHRESRSTDRTMWSMSVLMAQSYTDAMSDNIKRSLEHKRCNGEWSGPAPLGYLNKRKEDGRSDIALDPIRGPIIQRIFQEYVTGAYTITEMTKKAKQWGLRSQKGNHLTKSVIHRMLKQSFYHGEMVIKGEKHVHCYERLIDKTLFNACEEVRLGYNKKPFKYAGKDFVFRGILTCATSGRVVTADTKTKKYKNGTSSQWTYLRCWNPENPEKRMWVREDKVMAQIESVFWNLGIRDKKLLDQTIAYIKKTSQIKKASHNQELRLLKKEHTEIQGKLDRLVDLRLDGEIGREDFEGHKSRLKDRQYEIDQLITTYDKADDSFTKTLTNLLTLASEAETMWKGSTIAQKRELLNFVFANLELKGSTLCYTLRKPFDSFLGGTSCPEWRRGWDSNPRYDFSHAGFQDQCLKPLDHPS